MYDLEFQPANVTERAGHEYSSTMQGAYLVSAANSDPSGPTLFCFVTKREREEKRKEREEIEE